MTHSDTEQEEEADAERFPSFDGVRWTSCTLKDFTDL
ncbi:hypothetical protein SAMN05192561_1341 [Halopenitus malekzadehii]|uniref:Uncharacterized protein n=1 Tax=Halopenitus malekzadehii TaxID=1267564 RepID=A0A1H6K660_9EURY|nr:hypothetical protein SAMN05192561_1341 [Halopenitus malekzadehii]